MADRFSISPFKDSIVSPAGTAEKPNLGQNPDSPVAPKTGEAGTVKQAELPKNDLHMK
jgi:hypothetical protein